MLEGLSEPDGVDPGDGLDILGGCDGCGWGFRDEDGFWEVFEEEMFKGFLDVVR